MKNIWRDDEGRLWARVEPAKININYINRMYYKDLEKKYNVKFRTKKYQLYGKERDGITDAQKRKLWAIGVNITGIMYKGTASEIIAFVENLKFPKPAKLYQVIYRVNGKQYRSNTLYHSESLADYDIGKRIPPRYDAEVVPYLGSYWQTINDKCYASELYAYETGEEYHLVTR